MFRSGRDWPVACNEIPNLMMAPTRDCCTIPTLLSSLTQI